ncbi:MAG TPA: pyruvate dehydrogenase (acetyl-transferring) E1 component subunit alpha [Candidatus Dormibacteraeota bacterium]
MSQPVTLTESSSAAGRGGVTATWQEIAPNGALGEPAAHPADLSPERLRELYRFMALGRRIDGQAINLTRQGALGVFASSHGQEAVEVGAALALEAGDWLFPTYRETVAAFVRGVDVVEVLTLFSGSWHGGFDPMRYRVAPFATPLATQVLHATGLAMAARLRGDRVVALTFLGDGAASEGDAHEAMNIAAVSQAPCVFLLQNNQYAISVPLRLQTRASALALRAAGYGMPGIRVDGNDAVSVHAAVRGAVERARAGDGPTLIEAVTYRMGAHTTADDASRYRSAEEVDEWQGRDPLARHLALLRDHGLADDAFLEAVRAEGEAIAAHMRAALYGAPAGDPLEMFDHVYSARTPLLEAQRAQLAAELAAAAEVG